MFKGFGAARKRRPDGRQPAPEPVRVYYRGRRINPHDKANISSETIRYGGGREQHQVRVLLQSKMKFFYNISGKLDRLLSNGHQILCHLGHFAVTMEPGTLRPGSTPIGTPIVDVCRRSLEVKKVSSRINWHCPYLAARLSTTNQNSIVLKKGRYNKRKSTRKNATLKLLLDLHDARPAPTKPGCWPAYLGSSIYRSIMSRSATRLPIVSNTT
jgi:hypothetical protein